eukprot:scaffold204_cov100-Skeletonema_dohrnii-CCMP3373.AAC.12
MQKHSQHRSQSVCSYRIAGYLKLYEARSPVFDTSDNDGKARACNEEVSVDESLAADALSRSEVALQCTQEDWILEAKLAYCQKREKHKM